MIDLHDVEHVHIVAYGLLSLIDNTIHTLQGIYAFGDNYRHRTMVNPNEDWYALAYSALLERLAIDIASLIDRAKYKDDRNCNFKELKHVLEESSDHSPQYQNVIDEIDRFIQKYDDILPDRLRNKILAHKDLVELFSGNDYDLDIITITRFLNEGYLISSKVLKLAVGAGPDLPDMDLIKKKYEDSIALPLKNVNK